MGQKNRQKVAKNAKLAKSRQNGKKTPKPPMRHVAKPGEAGRSVATIKITPFGSNM